MGFFSPNYDKPGKGVDKNERQKKGIFLFFELFFRNFKNIIKAGMLSFLTSIPTLIITSIVVFVFVNNITDAPYWQAKIMIAITAWIGVYWGTGPATAGLAYVFRCYARREHSWIFSDFCERLKSNLVQSLIVFVVDIIVLGIGATAVYAYFLISQQSGAIIWFVLFNLSVLAMLVYSFIHVFIYQIMITYECKTKDLYKNSMIFALGKAPVNFLLFILSFVITFTLVDLIGAFAGIIIMFILFGILRFPIEFYAAKTIEKLLPKEDE